MAQAWFVGLRMRAVRRFVVALMLLVAGTAGARAGYSESQAWFNGLPLDARTEIQGDLILLGYYSYLVDGAFGQGTYSSITAFQRSLRRAVTGVLSEGDLSLLSSEADRVAERLGLDQVEDAAGQLSLFVPTTLLTQSAPAERGTTYTSEDGGITLVTVRTLAADSGFADLYANRSAAATGRLVSYASYNTERFVVSGTESGRRFYMMYRNLGTEAVGYEMSWTQAYQRDATIVSTYLASYAEPLQLVLETAEQEANPGAFAMRRYGAFTLPETKPYAIQLNDAIGNSTARDFERALQARPDASVLILNSPGGYVDTALVIANTVYQRRMTTIVPAGSGCYSACAYIYFAGSVRQVEGELGVHQIYTEVADLVFAQTTLSDILDALDLYGVQQAIISHMLRTPPEKMYVFTRTEIEEWRINQGDPIQLADISPDLPVDRPEVTPASTPQTVPAQGGNAFVHLAQFSSRAEAERSLDSARNRWGGIIGNTALVIEPVSRGERQSFRVSVPAPSLENANAICAAIKSSGGGCYVTPSGS